MQHLLRHRRTSRTGTFCEAHRLAKRVLDLHRGAREPYLQSGGEQKMVDDAIMEGEDRRCYEIVSCDHGVGHLRPLSITRQRHWLAYHVIAVRHEDLCQGVAM